MTSVRQILSFTLGSLLAPVGIAVAFQSSDSLRARTRSPSDRMRRRTARSEALCLLTEEKSLVGLNQPAPQERRSLIVGVIDSVTAIRKAPEPGNGCLFRARG